MLNILNQYSTGILLSHLIDQLTLLNILYKILMIIKVQFFIKCNYIYFIYILPFRSR